MKFKIAYPKFLKRKKSLGLSDEYVKVYKQFWPQIDLGIFKSHTLISRTPGCAEEIRAYHEMVCSGVTREVLFREHKLKQKIKRLQTKRA